MPTYEYACSSCQNEWEFEQSIKDAALTDCPKCHQQTARRQISRGTGFILKGSGWYSDLYASPSNKPATASTEGSSAEKPSTSNQAEVKTSSDTGGKGDGAGSSNSGSSSETARSTPASKSESSVSAA